MYPLFILTHTHTQFVIIVYICLLADGLPIPLILVGILTHVCFGSLLTTFPVISILSPGFIGGTRASTYHLYSHCHRNRSLDH